MAVVKSWLGDNSFDAGLRQYLVRVKECDVAGVLGTEHVHVLVKSVNFRVQPADACQEERVQNELGARVHSEGLCEVLAHCVSKAFGGVLVPA